MSRALKIFLGLTVIAVFAVGYLINNRAPMKLPAPASPSPSAPEPAAAVPKAGDSSAPLALPTVVPAPAPILLTKENFEESAARCFEGHPCEFAEDPWKMYLHFRDSQHPRVCDSIIAVVRRKMSEPEFKEQYKGPLLSMIEDFYSTREIDFQRAAYYAYLGELEKSLRLYLELEKRVAADPSLRPAPKLNIANLYYDLGRLSEALPYYQAALEELRKDPAKLSNQRSVVEFIEKRIEEISGAPPAPPALVSKEATR